jgi:hypothetical protein
LHNYELQKLTSSSNFQNEDASIRKQPFTRMQMQNKREITELEERTHNTAIT